MTNNSDINKEMDKAIKEQEEIIKQTTDSLASLNPFDGLNYSISTEDLSDLAFAEGREQTTVKKVMVGSVSSVRYPTFKEEENIETEITLSRKTSSSTLSSQTRHRLEAKIENLENKIEVIHSLIEQLVKQKTQQEKCADCGKELLAQVVQLDK